MTRWWRWTAALLLCGVAAVLGPPSAATAAPAPAADAGAGTVVADLGVVKGELQPGFSADGAYYASVAAAGDACDLHVWDVAARRLVTLANTHVACDHGLVSWASNTDTLIWQVAAATAGEVTEYAWDAGSGQTSVLAADAHVLSPAQAGRLPAVSADGRFLFFVGRSASHPAPPVDDDPEWAGYVYDRSTGVSLPLSKTGIHVQFASWGPAGHTFLAAANAGNDIYGGPDGCFGSGTSCRVVPGVYVTLGGAQWSADGKAVIPDPDDFSPPLVYDYTNSSATRIPTGDVSGLQWAQVFGPGGRWVSARFHRGSGVWDRTTGKVTLIPASSYAFPAPSGRYLLTGYWSNGTFRTFDLSSGGDSQYSTFYGDTGSWTDESTFLGTGPGGCTSLRQWSRSANTVSLFGPPAPHSCFDIPSPDFVKSLGSASGRFGLVYQVRDSTQSLYVADLRRHMLLGPFQGRLEDEGFAPGGTDVFALHQPVGDSDRVLLVDPTPVPDVDDKPRWSAGSPANGASLDLTVGQRGSLTFGASDPQQTPVTLYFRWRARAGYPVATPTPGWSCVQKRLSGGAAQASCTFAPTATHREIRYVDVWAKNDATGAQSDTRSYLVASTPASAGRSPAHSVRARSSTR